MVPETNLVIKQDNKVQFTDFHYFDNYFQLDKQRESEIVLVHDISIASKHKKFTKINAVMRRYHQGWINVITLDNGYSLKATDDHSVEITREDTIMTIPVSNLHIHDRFELTQYDLFETNQNHTAKVISIQKEVYEGYVYDFTTENHFFDANGIITHNCCQIDLEKLFKGGFSTGNGYIREPQGIRSYASLACIAIQSNQNKLLFV